MKEIGKRKIALVVGYIGTKYYGLQISDAKLNIKTIEVSTT